VREEVCRIASREGLSITDDAMDAIIYIAQGDMRKAINALQGAAIIRNSIDETMVYAITSTARPDEINELLTRSLKGDFDGAESLLAHLLHERGIAPNELINQCYRTILNMDIDRKLKVRLIDHIGETDFRLSEGANSDIQLEAMLARFVISSEKREN
jgi:replication factor C small subunit